MTWMEYRLDELGHVARGRSRHRPRDAAHLYGGPYPFVQTGDIKHAELYVTSYSQSYSEAGFAQSKMWPKGTLCITIAANIAETAILGMDACFPDSVIGFIGDPDKCDTKFIKYKFDILKYQYQQFSQGAAQDNLSREKLLSIKLSIPSPSTQRRIAGILSAYDDLIENNRRRIQLLGQAGRLIYQECFVRLRYPGHEHVRLVDGVPEGWERTSVGRLSSYLNRGISPHYDDDSEGLVINQKCIRDRFLDMTKARRQKRPFGPEKQVQVGDVLINSTGEGTLGRIAQVTAEIPNCTVDSHVTIVRPSPEIGWRYFGMALMELEPHFSVMGRGATNQTELSRATIADAPLLAPTKPLVDSFETLVAPISQQVLNLSEQIGRLRQARDLLLPKLMSGEIAV